MRYLILIPALLAGCATTPRPDIAAGQLNTQRPRFVSDECQRARSEALQYDENVPGQIGRGALYGLLGPIGVGMAMMSVQSRKDREADIVTRMRAACE